MYRLYTQKLIHEWYSIATKFEKVLWWWKEAEIKVTLEILYTKMDEINQEYINEMS